MESLSHIATPIFRDLTNRRCESPTATTPAYVSDEECDSPSYFNTFSAAASCSESMLCQSHYPNCYWINPCSWDDSLKFAAVRLWQPPALLVFVSHTDWELKQQSLNLNGMYHVFYIHVIAECQHLQNWRHGTGKSLSRYPWHTALTH